MLTATLKSLETGGQIDRRVYPQIPPKVEYTLTTLDESLLPAITMLKRWAVDSRSAVLEARNRMQSNN
jgi:DNA-binding HxlR family transcriptional regulator